MTSKQRVTHDPDWYEPYRISLAIKANGLLFVSGQAGIDEAGRTVGPGDFETQARRAFANLATVLRQGGSSLADVVKVTIMVSHLRARVVPRASRRGADRQRAGYLPGHLLPLPGRGHRRARRPRPVLHAALQRGHDEGWSHVVLDGTVVDTDRLRVKTLSKKHKTIDAWYSGKTRDFGGNIQALTRPDGLPV
jgi:enamine deaminase RidA (YjgF/YER057c/UK114 family)